MLHYLIHTCIAHVRTCLFRIFCTYDTYAYIYTYSETYTYIYVYEYICLLETYIHVAPRQTPPAQRTWM
jgi:hypothetical protein